MTADEQRWARLLAAGETHYGLVYDDDTAGIVEGSPFSDWRLTGERLKLSDAKLLAPVIPPTFYACGINYAAHGRACAEEFNRPIESLWPKRPEVGYRAQSAIIGPGDTIVLPADAPPNVQCESELAVVIGKAGKRVRAADAEAHIMGYMIANDVSIRGWQFNDRTFWRSKNSDTFKPLGPWITTSADIGAMTTTVSVNGDVKEHFATGKMLYSIADYIEAISQYITLQPGDVIMMGTDGHSPEIRHGDTISIEISGLGVLANPVVREEAV